MRTMIHEKRAIDRTREDETMRVSQSRPLASLPAGQDNYRGQRSV
jgi:hypothetical protein